MRKEFACPNCGAQLTKRSADKTYETVYDGILNEARLTPRQTPVLVGCKVGNTRSKKRPSQGDLEKLEAAERALVQLRPPSVKFMFRDGKWGDEWRKGRHTGVTHAHDFFFARPLAVIGRFAQLAKERPSAHRYLWLATSVAEGSSKLNRERLGGLPSKLSGTLYIGSTIREPNVIEFISRKIKKFPTIDRSRGFAAISTQSATTLSIPDRSVDYIFIDPPFGDNLQYSELNFLWEYILGVFTNQEDEAVVSKTQGKGLGEYRSLLELALRECYRTLKPGCWCTVEFHNSRNRVWRAIQEALLRAGFVVADVRTLDKQQGSFKQVTALGAVKQDLIISAYRPTDELVESVTLELGSEAGAWRFVREHLSKIPVSSGTDSFLEPVAERQAFLLFDRMVAFHVQRGREVPVSYAEFCQGLNQRFPERDGMYFLPEQVSEYDRKRVTVGELRQLDLFVTDEASAIQWLRQRLHRKPQSFQDLQPDFMREVQAWSKHEMTVELTSLLELSFLNYDGRGPVPSQVHSYLSSNFKDLRNLEKEDPRLKEKASDRWYVPDPNKQADLDQLRNRALLKEFEEYKASTQRKLKVFRTEAVRAGFKSAWQARDYGTIVKVAEKLPAKVLQEDQILVMYYDNALTRMGEPI